MNLDKVESGVRLIARAVSCKCTKMPRDVQKILKDARKCTVKLYKKNNLKGKILQKFVTSNTQGKTFLNNVAMKRPVQEMLTDDLGEAGKAHTTWGKRRRAPHVNWGAYVKSAKLEGACANVEYVGASPTVASACVLSVGVSDDDIAGCNFNNEGCLSPLTSVD